MNAKPMKIVIFQIIVIGDALFFLFWWNFPNGIKTFLTSSQRFPNIGENISGSRSKAYFPMAGDFLGLSSDMGDGKSGQTSRQ